MLHSSTEFALWKDDFMMRLELTHGSIVVPFLGLPYRVLHMNHKKELLWNLWVGTCNPNWKPQNLE